MQSSPDQCGIRGPSGIFLVIGGQAASDGSWPWQVGLVRTDRGEHSTYCGGSIISDRLILTAAHCLYTKKSPFSNSFIRLACISYLNKFYYSCSLSTATIEYSSPLVCLWVCLSVYMITQNSYRSSN